MVKKSVFLLICTALLCAVTPGWGAVPGLVGWWSFDEGAGDVAADGSGNGNDGAIIDATWTAGQLGSALEFAGAGYVDIPPESWSEIEQQATAAVWMYIDSGVSQSPFTFAAYQDPAVNDERVFSTHAVWSDGNVYFDTGHTGGAYDRISKAITASEYGDAWVHWAFVKNADTGEQKIYINGELWHSGSGMTRSMTGVTKFTLGAKPSLENYWTGIMDDFQLYNVELTQEQVQEAMQGISVVAAASPIPASGAVDVLRDEAAMSWVAGKFADTHTVYLSTSLDDVTNGAAAAIAAEGLTETSFDPGRLELGAQYFWRVDEVNAAPDNTVFPGEVWNYTIEPVSLPVTVVSATASSADGATDVNNIINGVGLNENDEHGVSIESMWAGASEDATPSVEFTLEALVKLDKVHVWNHNSQTESILGFGFKEALIEYSADGETWSELATVELPQAPGDGTYAGTDVDLGGVMAMAVKITGLSNHSILGLPQKGLAEVRFYAIPVQAREPMPADGSTTADGDITLGWRSGREAAEHEVVFSTDEQAVIDGSAVVATVSDASHDLGTLTLATPYFWKINEMNDVGTPAAYEGSIWSFQTPEYLVIDDMEMYTTEEGLFIWEHWVDGFDNPTENGAVVGNGDEAETTIVHGGSQSLPITYNNNGAPLSEATLQIGDQDWLTSGGKTLALYFHGTAGNTGQLYVKINDARIDYSGDASDLTQSPWHTWNIDLSTVGGDMSKVTSVTVGVSGGGATGKIYIDDIRLYPVLGEVITPVEPDAASLLAHYTFDGDFSDSAGNNDGTALGDAKIATDPARGQVLSLDGDDDAVSIPLLAEANEVTISMWVNPLDAITPTDWKSTFAGSDWTEGDIHWRILNNRIDGGVNGHADGNLTGSGVVPYEQWSLVVVTLSPSEFAFWLNGIEDTTRALDTGPTLQIGDGLIGAWLTGEVIDREWAGTIDDVRIYNRVLSEGEVLWLAGKTAPVDKPL